MKKQIFPITLVMALTCTLLSFSAYSQTSTSKWLATPLTVDGSNTDWGGRPSYFSSECMISYELRNDNNNIFLIIEIVEKESQMKFMHAGFEIAMKVKSKPKLKATINFLPQQRQEQGLPDVGRDNNINGMDEGYLLSSKYAEIGGFLKTSDIINRNINGNQDFTYNIGWNDRNNMLVEIQIPISEVFDTANAEVDYTQIPISLIYKLNALERPSGEQMHPEGGGMGSGGGMGGGGASGGRSGGIQGGGGRPGGQGGSPADMQSMNGEQTFKAKFYLSKGN